MDEISFHDLHVVDVEQEPHTRAVHALDQFDAVSDAVEEVVRALAGRRL